VAEPITALTSAPIIGVTAPTSFSLPPGPPQHDMIERVPEERKELFRKLSQRRADAHRLIPEFETIREASMARVDAENVLRKRTSPPQDFGDNLPPTDPLVFAAKKHLEKMTADFKRLTELQEVRSAAWQAASAALTACEDWLRYGVPANCQIEAIEVEPPKLLKSEGLMDGVARLQRRGREIKATIHSIRSSPFPKDHCKRRAHETVEALERRGAISVSRLVELDGEIEWPMQRASSQVIGGAERALAFHETVDVVGLIAFIFKDALIAALDREIDAEADDAAALTHEQRQQREAEALGDLLAVEREESWFVWQAQSQGLPIEHRADISPLALPAAGHDTACRRIAAIVTRARRLRPYRRQAMTEMRVHPLGSCQRHGGGCAAGTAFGLSPHISQTALPCMLRRRAGRGICCGVPRSGRERLLLRASAQPTRRRRPHPVSRPCVERGGQKVRAASPAPRWRLARWYRSPRAR
jgi:hypothetical protein